MKKFILLLLVLVLFFWGCAPPIEPNVVIGTPEPNDNYSMTRLQGGSSYYTLDYWEDKEHDYGGYVYDGSESGDLFCF